MKKNNIVVGTKGFTIIETALSVAMMSVVILTASHMVLKVSQGRFASAHSRSAVTLSDMVFEQYSSYARVNFASLPLYDSTNVEPKDFFFQPTNLGFDGMRITTLATYGVSRSSCSVHVVIAWGGSVNANSLSFTRVLTEQTHLQPGAILQVYAKLPCAFSADNDVIANCQAIPGIKVTAANSDEHSSVSATTNSSGLAVLTGVAAGDNIVLTLEPRNMTDYTVNPTAPAYVPGYYAVDNAGHYVTMVSSVVVADDRQVRTFVFTNLRPTGIVQGNVNGGSGIPLAVRLSTPAVVSYQGRFVSCEDGVTCSVSTDSSGNYYFANVIPSTVSLFVDGRSGSSALVQPTDPAFSWGYTGLSTTTILANGWSATPPVIHQDLTAVKRGSLRMTVLMPSGAPAAGAVFKELYLQQGDQNYWLSYTNPPLTTDSNGQFALYNIVNVLHSYDTVSLSVTSGGDDFKKLVWVPSNAALGAQTELPVQLLQNYQVTFKLVDDAQNPVSLQGGGLRIAQGSWLDTTLDAANSVTTGVCIDCVTTNAAVPFPITLVENLTSQPRNAAASGQIVDDLDPSQIAPHAAMAVNRLGGWTYVTADNQGNYDTGSLPFPWSQSQAAMLNCDTALRTCTPVGGVLHVDTSQLSAQTFDANYAAPTNTSYFGWHIAREWQNLSLVEGTTKSGQLVTAVLGEFMVQGVIRDGGTGRGIPGIRVEDAAVWQNAVNTSDGSDGRPVGSYSLWCKVVGRVAPSSLHPGSVGINIPANQAPAGSLYPGATPQALMIPIPAATNIPLAQDVTLGGVTTSHT